MCPPPKHLPLFYLRLAVLQLYKLLSKTLTPHVTESTIMPRYFPEELTNLYVHMAIFKMDDQQGLLIAQELCSRLCGSLDGWGVWGRMGTCICVAESLHCPPETITALLTGNAPIQNKRLNKQTKRLCMYCLTLSIRR